jgi:hypothetical protein
LPGDVKLKAPGRQARAYPGHPVAGDRDVQHRVQPGFRVDYPPAPQYHVKLGHNGSIPSPDAQEYTTCTARPASSLACFRPAASAGANAPVFGHLAGAGLGGG